MLDGYLWAVDARDCRGCIVERYDFNTNSWELIESIGRPGCTHYNTAVVALDGLIYVIGMDGTGSCTCF